MSKQYTRMDMASAWDEGYKNGVKDGVYNYIHDDMIAIGLYTAALPVNPYISEPKRLAEFELPEDYTQKMKGKVL